jgi:hypothetical protein
MQTVGNQTIDGRDWLRTDSNGGSPNGTGPRRFGISTQPGIQANLGITYEQNVGTVKGAGMLSDGRTASTGTDGAGESQAQQPTKGKVAGPLEWPGVNSARLPFTRAGAKIGPREPAPRPRYAPPDVRDHAAHPPRRGARA